MNLFASDVADNKVVMIENTNPYKLSDTIKIDSTSEDLTEEENTDNSDSILNSESTDSTLEENNEEKVNDVEDTNSSTALEIAEDYAVIKTMTGVLTGYGPNCDGCSGITASGYDVRYTTTYNDAEFGEVRVVAADPSIPFYSIVRISNVPGMEPIIAIVLDIGGNVGYGRGTLFDLLYASEQEALHKTENVTFEILREGN